MFVEESASFRREVTVTATLVPARLAVEELTVMVLDETEYQVVAASVGLNVSVSVGVAQAASGIATV